MVDKATYFQKIGYKPHPEQRKFHESKARFRVPVCGRRFGKSTMAARDLEPELFSPKKRFWIVGPTYDLAEKEFRVVWDDLIIGQGLGRDKRVKKSYNKKQGDMYIEFPWQTRLEARSAQHPDDLVGEALDGLIVSEAAKQREETWKRFLNPSLSDKRGFATFPTTPEGFNWLHRIWQLGQHPDHKDWASWQFASWANTVVYPDGRQDAEILRLEAESVHEWFMQEIAAEFSAFVGKIYGEWNETKHVDRVIYNPAWPNYVAFDWGYTNPLAAIEFQVTPMDQVRIWREHYLGYTTLPDHFRIMSRRHQPEGYKITTCFGDAADPEAVAQVNASFAPCFADPKAKENWRAGIMVVKKFLKMRGTALYDDQGHQLEVPGLVVDHSCVNVIREFNNYKSKAPVRGNNVPEMGQKQDDHALDAIRYGLMHLFELGAMHHLDEVMDDDIDVTAFVPEDVSSLWMPDDAGIFTMNGRF
jgi:hypothetical protein